MDNQPTEKDIAYLRAHPDVAEKFEAQFGQGTAAAYTNEEGQAAPSQETPQEAPEEDKPSLLGDILQGANHGIQEAVNGAVDGAEFVNDTGWDILNAGSDLLEKADGAASRALESMGIPSRIQITNKDGEFDPKFKTLAESEGDKTLLGGDPTVIGDAAHGERTIEVPEIDVINAPVTTLGNMTSSTTQFIAGAVGMGKVTGLKGLAGAFVNGGLTDALIFDPNDANLSAFMQSNNFAVPLLTEALATDPDDPEWLNRMRNVTEGALFGTALDYTMKGLKGLAKVRKAALAKDDAAIKEGMALIDEAADDASTALKVGVDVEAPKVATPAPAKSLVDIKAIQDAYFDKDLITPDQIADSLWFNTEKMSGSTDAHTMIEMAGDALDRSGALDKLGLDKPETHARVMKDASEEIAEITGANIDDFTAKVAEVATSSRDQAKFVVAGKMALQSTGREISNTITKLEELTKLGRSDVNMEARLIELIDTHANLQAQVKSVQTNAARATSAGKIVTGDGIEAQALSSLELVRSRGGSKAVHDAIEKLKLAKTPADQAKIARKLSEGGVGKRAMQLANEVFINSILSGWSTHAVNITSNTVNMLYLPTERAVGGLLTGNKAQLKAAAYQYAEMRTAVMDGARLAGRVLLNENPVLDSAVKLENMAEGQKAFSAARVGLDKSHAAGSLVEKMGHIIRLPGRLLMAEDEFFKQVIFRSRLKSKLMVDAAEMSAADLKKMGFNSAGEFVEHHAERATMSFESLDKAWKQAVDEGRVAETPKAREEFIRENLGAANEADEYAKDALRVARDATFTTPLAPDSLSGGIQSLANRHPILRQITPFIQTPTNLLGKAFDRIPGMNLALRDSYRQRIRSTNPDIRAEAMGEMATGVAIGTSLFMLASEGRITGSGPTDSKQRALWTADKSWQPYSINVGSKEDPVWVDFSRFDPFAFTLGVAGDIAEMTQAAENDPSIDKTGMMAMMLMGTINNVSSKTWLQGISDVVEMANAKDSPYKAQRFLENRLAAFVPFSSAQRSYNQAGDPYQREARGYLDKVKTNVAGLGDQVPVKYDWVTGEAMDRPKHLLGYVKVSAEGEDTVLSEMRKLQYGFSGPDRKIGAVTLSTEQYQAWNRLMGSVKIGGQTLHGRLEKVMKTERYDIGRERVPDGITTPAESHRVEALTGIISKYKQKARAELFQEYPELYKAWDDYRRYARDAQQGQAQEGDRENILLKQ
jgi:hypothetical protein